MWERCTRLALVVAVVAVVSVSLAGVRAAPAGADEGVRHRPPVDAPVVDPFRPPATRYGPGNRGLTYDLPADTTVRASGPGTVVYAGPVGGTHHVTVLHPDGLRTSYSFLRSIGVRRGQTVDAGDPVGTAGRGFHFGLRDGDDTYLDPAGLFGGTTGGAVAHRVRLVPHTEPLPPTDAGIRGEHAALRALVAAERPGLLRRALGWVVDRASPVVRRLGEVGSITWHLARELPPPSVAADVVVALWDELAAACTPSDMTVARPPGERVALLVAGLGSSSDHGAIDELDLDGLGYDRPDVVRYSYRGGRVPTTDQPLHPALAGLPATPYDAADTNGDIRARGRALADLVLEVARARPGTPIDLYAHSLGGLVTRVALLELAARPGGLAALGHVVTIATPHRGADLATAGRAAGPSLRGGLDAVGDLAGLGVDPSSTAIAQLSETSALVDRLDDAGVPDGVDFRTVAGRGDLIVAADKAHVDGHPSAVVGAAGVHAHGELPGDPAVTRELRLALAGLPPACQGFASAVLDAVVPQTVSLATDTLTLGALLTSGR